MSELAVLHVDPDAEFVSDAERVLRRRAAGSLSVTHVPNVVAALDALAERRFDCVITEFTLEPDGADPDETKTGLDLLHRVRDMEAAPPVIMVTGSGSEAVAEAAIGAGVTDYLRKGDDAVLDTLARRVVCAVTADRAERANRDRTRELSTLHAVTASLSTDDPLDERLWAVVESLPGGWDEAVAARIEIDGVVYETPNYPNEPDDLDETSRTTAIVGETTVTVSVIPVGDGVGGEPTGSGGITSESDSTSSTPFASASDASETDLLRTVADLVAAHVDRAETVERLRAFAERLETILQHTTNVVFMKDLEGRYVLVNHAFEEFVGLDTDEILGRETADLFDADTAARMHAHDEETLAAGELCRFEERYVREGEPRRFVTVRVPLYDSDGEPYAVYGIATDITEETRLAEERVELLDRMTDGFFAVNEDDEITYLNERAADLIGVNADTIVGEDLWEAFPRVRNTKFQSAFERAKRTGEPVTRTDYYEPRDRWFETRFYPSDSGVSLYLRDVTDTVAERQELEQRERTMRRLYETIADKEADFAEQVRSLLALGKEVLDVESGLLSHVEGDEYVAEIAEDDTGQFTEGAPVPLSATNCERVVASERSIQVADVSEEPELAERAGHTEMGISCYVGAPVFVEDEVYGTFCFYDLTSRTEPFTDWEVTLVDLMARWVSYELERQRAATELARERDRLEAFAGMVSHDLRNPLTVAAGHLDLAREDVDHESLDQAARALDRMRVLIDDALSFARLGNRVVEYEAVDLAGVATEAWGTVDTGDAELQLADPGRVAGDTSRIRTLFENLFRNSVEHASTSSRAKPGDAMEHAGTDAVIEVGSIPGGFYVEDNGPGFPADATEDVFGLGYTTRQHGTGLGLAIVHEIAEAHGWEVTAENAEDGGARVAFREVDRPRDE